MQGITSGTVWPMLYVLADIRRAGAMLGGNRDRGLEICLRRGRKRVDIVVLMRTMMMMKQKKCNPFSLYYLFSRPLAKIDDAMQYDATRYDSIEG